MKIFEEKICYSALLMVCTVIILGFICFWHSFNHVSTTNTLFLGSKLGRKVSTPLNEP